MINIKSAREILLLRPSSINCFLEHGVEKDSEVACGLHMRKEENGSMSSNSLTHRCQFPSSHPLSSEVTSCIPHSSEATPQNIFQPSSWCAMNLWLGCIKNHYVLF